jgi:nicotinate-nucleotide adenylyltransferase
MTSVAFFGGSFDPPHFGHVLAATLAIGQGFDRLLIVPVRAHAFGKRLSAFEHRVAMARLAFAPLPAAEVSEIERELPAPSFTLNTLRAIVHQNPSWQLRLLIGSDVLSDIPRWSGFEEVQRLAPPWVFARKGFPNPNSGPELVDISSTCVRSALARRRADPTSQGWLETRVPRAVIDYIERQGLYLEEH